MLVASALHGGARHALDQDVVFGELFEDPIELGSGHGEQVEPVVPCGSLDRVGVVEWLLHELAVLREGEVLAPQVSEAVLLRCELPHAERVVWNLNDRVDHVVQHIGALHVPCFRELGNEDEDGAFTTRFLDDLLHDLRGFGSVTELGDGIDDTDFAGLQERQIFVQLVWGVDVGDERRWPVWHESIPGVGDLLDLLLCRDVELWIQLDARARLPRTRSSRQDQCASMPQGLVIPWERCGWNDDGLCLRGSRVTLVDVLAAAVGADLVVLIGDWPRTLKTDSAILD